MTMELRLRMVEVLQVKRLGDRTFAEKRGRRGRSYWEEISGEEAVRFRAVKSPYVAAIDLSPPTSPVTRILEGGHTEYGSAICYKGIGPGGRHEYWHIPTGVILVEEEGYALRQVADTIHILDRWMAGRRLELAAL